MKIFAEHGAQRAKWEVALASPYIIIVIKKIWADVAEALKPWSGCHTDTAHSSAQGGAIQTMGPQNTYWYTRNGARIPPHRKFP